MKVLILRRPKGGRRQQCLVSQQANFVAEDCRPDRQPDTSWKPVFANGGQISVSHAEPWSNLHAPMRALSWMGREDAPLLFRLRWDTALFD